jgi:hypothetical protein
LNSECTDRLRPSETSFVDDPKTSILLPWEVTEEVVFWINIVAKGTGAKEGVHITAIRELTKNLTDIGLAKVVAMCTT